MRLTPELRDRTKAFASSVIRFYVSLPKEREEVSVLGLQLFRAGTSVASHAREASRARSDAEFCSKLDVLLQEAEKAQLWLELLRDDGDITGPKTEFLIGEAGEILAIFTSIVSRIRKKS